MKYFKQEYLLHCIQKLLKSVYQTNSIDKQIWTNLDSAGFQTNFY